MYVVTVRFDLLPEHARAFRAPVLENAATSLRDETGCHRFDVCFSDEGTQCFLYELYTDRTAFEEHLRSGHFLRFDEGTAAMVRDRRVETYHLAGDEARDA
jgi:autoinducer 2-degrading protein